MASSKKKTPPKKEDDPVIITMPDVGRVRKRFEMLNQLWGWIYKLAYPYGSGSSKLDNEDSKKAKKFCSFVEQEKEKAEVLLKAVKKKKAHLAKAVDTGENYDDDDDLDILD